MTTRCTHVSTPRNGHEIKVCVPPRDNINIVPEAQQLDSDGIERLVTTFTL